jgi:hypothetical protein
MSKGGVYGSFVLVKLTKGTSKRYKNKSADAKATETAKDKASSRSPLVYVKEPIAQFFGFAQVSKTDLLKDSTKSVKTTINGQVRTVKTTVNSGATGAGRAVTVKFTKLEKIGGKDVASVRVAMPSSHTFGNMVDELINAKNNESIAAIVSPSGRTMTFKTPYHPKLNGQKALPAGK